MTIYVNVKIVYFSKIVNGDILDNLCEQKRLPHLNILHCDGRVKK